MHIRGIPWLSRGAPTVEQVSDERSVDPETVLGRCLRSQVSGSEATVAYGRWQLTTPSTTKSATVEACLRPERC